MQPEAIIIAILGLITAIFQWNRSIKVRKAEFVDSVNNRFRHDKNITDIIYLIDRGKFIYTADFHKIEDENSSIITEGKLDALLSTLNYICYLRKTGKFNREAFSFYEYSIVWVCKYDDIKNYLWNMYRVAHLQYDDVSKENECSCSFEFLIKFCLEKRIIDDKDDFFNNDEHGIYKKYYNPRGVEWS